MSTGIEYWLPFDTGALLLFGPTLLVLLTSALWQARGPAQGPRT
jgi:hypothetical protein